MGAVIAGVKMTIAQIILGIISVILEVMLVFALQAEGVQQQLEAVASDPSTATALPTTLIVILVVFVVGMIVLQGYVVNRLWGWS